MSSPRPHLRRLRETPRQRAGSKRISTATFVLFALFCVAAGLVIWFTATVAVWLAPAGAPVAVPNLIGMDLVEAALAAGRAHLTLHQIAARPDSKFPKDAVIGQLPYAGEMVREGRVIAVIISAGAPTTQVPQLGGMTEREAAVELENQRLDIGRVSRRQDNTVDAGTVIAQSVDPFTTLPIGSKVDVTVATGRPVRFTPAFIGLPLEVAVAAAKQNGIMLDAPRLLGPTSGAEPKGIVVAQDPMPGTTFDSSQKIALDVSGGAPPTPQPSPTVTPVLPNPEAMRGLRISVKLPAEPGPTDIRIVVQDGTGARTIWDQTTTGGFTLWFDLSVTGAATLETYANDQLVSANPI